VDRDGASKLKRQRGLLSKCFLGEETRSQTLDGEMKRVGGNGGGRMGAGEKEKDEVGEGSPSLPS